MGGHSGAIVLVEGLKSKSCVGLLNTPPKVIASAATEAVAGAFRVTRCFESMFAIYEPGGIPFPATAQYTCSRAVEERPRITGEPLLMLPDRVTGDGPASAAKMTWPLGNSAAGASSAPNGTDFGLGFARLLRVPAMSGPAAQVLVDGL